MGEDMWIESQTRTMTRWVSSKIGRKVENLKHALGDGLVLLDLVNALVAESNLPLGPLAPLYKKPKFTLQKMENINDCLQYCRLVLKVNTCNISADDIVGGNLKLILGLVWTLFVFATTSSLALKSESTSFAEVKTTMIRWLNLHRKHHALDEISNFNSDWSLQKGKRPDLMLASIFDHYSPGLFDCRDLTGRKPLANLSHIISLANTHLGIEELASADAFNVLVPDEKIVLLYVLQWYMTLVIEPSEQMKSDSVDSLTTSGKQQAVSFVSVLLAAKKLKNQYDTKSLRLSNQITFGLNRFRSKADSCQTLKLYLESGGSQSSSCSAELTNILNVYEAFAGVHALMARDYPELQVTYEAINTELSSSGLHCKYEPLKQLQLDALLNKYQELEAMASATKQEIDVVLTDFPQTSEFSRCLNAVSSLQSLECVTLQIADSKIDFAANGQISQPNATGKYPRFRDRVMKANNQKNLTFSDLKKLLRQLMSSDEFDGPELLEMVGLIPARTIVAHPESEALSDDSSGSVDSNFLFEEASRNLEHKLSGNYNKLYDVSALLTRLESGFQV